MMISISCENGLSERACSILCVKFIRVICVRGRYKGFFSFTSANVIPEMHKEIHRFWKLTLQVSSSYQALPGPLYPWSGK